MKIIDQNLQKTIVMQLNRVGIQLANSSQEDWKKKIASFLRWEGERYTLKSLSWQVVVY